MINTKAEIIRIQKFIREKCKKFNGGVIGLSGGIDSTLVAYLSVAALGKDRVFGVCLPYDKQGYSDGYSVAKILDIPGRVTNIKYMVDSFDSMIGCSCDIDKKDLVIGNLKARIRMCALYAYASLCGSLVLGTTNKAELVIGYYTKYGDGAVDIEPIAHLTKREVRNMAEELGVPDYLVNRVPSAELWVGQTDEGEFGFTYEELDDYIDGKRDHLNKKTIRLIEKLIITSEHKRHMAPSIV